MIGMICKGCSQKRSYNEFPNSGHGHCKECRKQSALDLKIKKEDRRPINERYCINKFGEVFKIDGQEVKPRLHKKSLVLRIDGLLKTVSGLIMKAYHCERPEGHVPQPIDGDHTNTSAENWGWEPTARHLETLATKEKDLDSDEFWELTEAQKKHYSTFLSLIRTPKTKAKGRKCLGCQTSLERQTKVENNYTCSTCKETIDRHGALAVG